jgi:phosphatidate cytidylyltransferase
MLRERALSAAVGIPAVFVLLFLDGLPALQNIPLLLLAAGIAAIGAEEVAVLLRGRGYAPAKWMGASLGPLPPLILYFKRPEYSDFVLLVLTLAIVFLVLTAFLTLIAEVAKRSWRALVDFALVAVGAGYVGGGLGVLLLLRYMDIGATVPWGTWPVMLIFLATWAMDAAAYLAGRRWGHHRLCPSVSPNKTVEGALFGLISSIVITAIFLTLATRFRHPWWSGAGIGLALGVAGEAGDLLESRFKRWVGVKDSGSLIPGHGGVLDRFDSLLLAAPVLYVILLVTLHG